MQYRLWYLRSPPWTELQGERKDELANEKRPRVGP